MTAPGQDMKTIRAPCRSFSAQPDERGSDDPAVAPMTFDIKLLPAVRNGVSELGKVGQIGCHRPTQPQLPRSHRV